MPVQIKLCGKVLQFDKDTLRNNKNEKEREKCRYKIKLKNRSRQTARVMCR